MWKKELNILKAKIKFRSITIESANELTLKLKKLITKEINISSSLEDGEAASYANQFKSLFEFAGWKVESGIGISSCRGVGIYVMTKNENNKEALKIKNIFAPSGIELQEQVMPEGAKMHIFIGSKNNNNLDNN